LAVNTRKENKVVFFVRGRQAQGSITLKNEGNERAKITTLDVNAPLLRDASGQVLKQVKVMAHLKPGQVQQCTVGFEVDSALPPGTYDGEFLCGTMLKQPFELHVSERLDISLYPDRLIIQGTPSQVMDKDLIITNQGNVPVKFNKQLTIMLSEVGEVSRVLGSTLHKEAMTGAVKAMDTFVTALQEAIVRPMILTFSDDNPEVNPGETKKFQINIHLPSNLKSKRSYRGRISLYNKTLSALIHCFDKN
jgi:hypothetical protein